MAMNVSMKSNANNYEPKLDKKISEAEQHT